jgi:hypothetical protein
VKKPVSKFAFREFNLQRCPTASAPRKEALDAFLAKWKDDNNVICTYLSMMATQLHSELSPLELGGAIQAECSLPI